MDFFSLGIILLLSIPVFYMWGLLSFIRLLFRGRSKNTALTHDRRGFLETVIPEIEKEVAHNPDKKLLELLVAYRSELRTLSSQTENAPVGAAETNTPTEIPEKRSYTPSQPVATEASFQNWYKDNSINLLLYIGAFLIIVSAAIFVGLPSASGMSKSMVLTILTLMFLLSGLWFATMPRIKTAGVAFTGIGALLIPICGFGWYNFVFKYLDIPSGIVWLLTSLVGLFVYIALARYFKSIFYSYVTSFSTLSFFLAFINMQGLQNDYYVLGAIISSISLLGASMYLKKNTTPDAKLFWEPFTITANVTLPAAIFYGLFVTSDTTYFTAQATASVFLGCLFYLLSYRFFRKSEYLFAAQILFTLGLIYFGYWQHMSTLSVLYILSTSTLINLYLVATFHRQGKEQEAYLESILCMIKPTVIFAYAQASDVAPTHLLLFACITMLAGVLLAYLRKNVFFVWLTSLFLSIALYILVVDIFHLTQPYILGLFYAVIATSWYTLAAQYRRRTHRSSVYGFSSIFFFLLSTLFIADSWRYQLFNASLMAIVAFSASYQLKRREFLYLGTILSAFALFTLVKLLHTPIAFYPLIFSGLSLVYYLISETLAEGQKEAFRKSALLGAVITPLVFLYYSYGDSFTDYYNADYEYNHLIERYSLLSSYVTFLLYSFDAVSRKSSKMAYTASAIGLLTYLWQVNFLGVTETQYYTFVIGAYFFTLAAIQRRKNNSSLKTPFDFLAAFFLIVPTWGETFGDNGATYALILGAIGVCYVVCSITYSDKFYRYSGMLAIVFAVVSQSKWAIIGLAGIAFLGFAFYLLLQRKDESQHLQ